MIRLSIPGRAVTQLAFTRSGDLLAEAEAGFGIRRCPAGSASVERFVIGFSPSDRLNALVVDRQLDRIALWRGEVSLLVWDLAERRPVDEFRLRPWGRYPVTFTPDGSELIAVSCRHFGLGCLLKRWQLNPVKLLPDITGPSEPVMALAVSPNGNLLATGGLGLEVRLWDLRANQPKGVAGWMSLFFERVGLIQPRELTSRVDSRTRIRSLAFSPDGTWLAAATGWTTTLRRMMENEPAPEVEPIDLRGHKRLVDSVTFSPDGRMLATGSRDGTVKLWDMTSMTELATFAWDIGKIYRVVFAPDGLRLVAGGDDGQLVLWDVD